MMMRPKTKWFNAFAACHSRSSRPAGQLQPCDVTLLERAVAQAPPPAPHVNKPVVWTTTQLIGWWLTAVALVLHWWCWRCPSIMWFRFIVIWSDCRAVIKLTNSYQRLGGCRRESTFVPARVTWDSVGYATTNARTDGPGAAQLAAVAECSYAVGRSRRTRSRDKRCRCPQPIALRRRRWCEAPTVEHWPSAGGCASLRC